MHSRFKTQLSADLPARATLAAYKIINGSVTSSRQHHHSLQNGMIIRSVTPQCEIGSLST